MKIEDITGIVAWRMWHLYALLTSTHGSLGWPSDSWTYPMRSKGMPTASNNKGLYSFSINDLEPTHELLDDYLGEISASKPQNERAMGIVELRGRILLHANGQFRSQWARPLIIWVDTSIEDSHMNKLSQAYQCPIIATNDFIKSYDKWTNDNQNLINQNVIKVACFGGSAESIFGIPQISREHYTPQKIQCGNKLPEHEETKILQKICPKCFKIFNKYDSCSHCPKDGTALLPFHPICKCGIMIECDYDIPFLPFTKNKPTPKNDCCSKCGYKTKDIVCTYLKNMLNTTTIDEHKDLPEKIKGRE